MAHITNVTCVCDLEVSNANEYEALEEVIKMIEKKYELSNKVSLIIKETVLGLAPFIEYHDGSIFPLKAYILYDNIIWNI